MKLPSGWQTIVWSTLGFFMFLSGVISGKSVLLKALENDIKQEMQATAINVKDIKPDPNKPLIETVGKTTQQTQSRMRKTQKGISLHSFTIKQIL